MLVSTPFFPLCRSRLAETENGTICGNWPLPTMLTFQAPHRQRQVTAQDSDVTSVGGYKTALAILQMHQCRWNMSTRTELIENWNPASQS